MQETRNTPRQCSDYPNALLFSSPIVASNRILQIQMQRESPAFEPRPKPTPLRHFGSRPFRKIGRVRFFIAVGR